MRISLTVALALTVATTDVTVAQNARRTAPRTNAGSTADRSRNISPAAANSRGRNDWKARLGDAKRDQFAQQNPNYSSGSAQPNKRYNPGHQPYGYNATPSYAPIYNDPYAAPLYFDANDYADIHFNRRYYDDGPNGPGYYYKDEWYNWYIANKRSEQLIDANRFITDEGMAFFSAGNYERAAVVWLNSASIHHGDAVSRLNAGHALFAIGRYADAISLLARAFELSPQLAGANYDIRDNYVIPGDFERHLARLQSFAKRNPNDLYGQLMMGYVLSYTNGPSHAYAYLQKSRQIVPNDPFIEKLWSFAVMIGPAVEIPEVDRINQRPPQLQSYVPEQSNSDSTYGVAQPMQSMQTVEQPARHVAPHRPPAHIAPPSDDSRRIENKDRDELKRDKMRLVRSERRHI